MSRVSQGYVQEVLQLQGVGRDPDAARAIAPVLAAQLEAAAPTYDRIAFEAEPAAFLVELSRRA
jgi:hypothetical protein